MTKNNTIGGGVNLRRRLMIARKEDDEMRDWVTIVDTVTTEEIMNPSYSALPDGNKIEDYNFREVVAYVIYNANEAQTTSGYVRLSLTDIDGKTASVQTTKGIQKTGYYRCLVHMQIGSVLTLCNAQESLNTTFSPAVIYDSEEKVLSAIKVINLISYANIGVGSTIKIMAR